MKSAICVARKIGYSNARIATITKSSVDEVRAALSGDDNQKSRIIRNVIKGLPKRFRKFRSWGA